MSKKIFIFALIIWGSLSLAGNKPEIVEVLENSRKQDLNKVLEKGEIYDTPAALQLQKDFQELLAKYGEGKAIQLKIVKADNECVNIMGQTIVVSESLGSKPEEVRKFFLTHEIAHSILGHWQNVCSLYVKHIPGAVVKEETDKVANVLGREAMNQSHQQEFEADSIAAKVFKTQGATDLGNVYQELMRYGAQDSATHPGARKRIMQIRMILAE